MKKQIALLLCVGLLLFACGCSQQKSATTESWAETDPPDPQIGLCLPNQTDERWLAAAQALTDNLETLGFEVILEDAENDVLHQAEQVSALLGKPIQALIVCPVDSIGLTEVLQHVPVPVIAYDRPLMNTDSVCSFVGYDYAAAGIAVAKEIISARQLESAKAENRSYTLELFMDTPESHNALLFYQGVMQQLQSYIDSGVLTVPSGRLLFEDCCLPEADKKNAATRLGQLLTDHYPEQWPDILLCGQDSIALGCSDALTAAGCPAEQWPVITGLDGWEDGLDKVAAGQQFLTSNYNAQTLASACVQAVEAALTGNPFGDVVYENGLTTVPTRLFAPELTVGTAPVYVPDPTESTGS